METKIAQVWLKNCHAFIVVGKDIFQIELRHTLRKKYVVKKLQEHYGKNITVEFML